MKISLDYDGTITEDPTLWLAFIEAAQRRGHQVFIVTMRYPSETVDPRFAAAVGGRVFYTSHALKMAFMLKHGHFINVWIDDAPGMVTGGADVLQWND